MAEHDRKEPQVATRVVVYTLSQIITGNLRPLVPVRLSDLMNNWQEHFFPLDDPRTIQLRAEQVEPVPEVGTLLVPWREILLLHEVPTRKPVAKTEGSTGMRVVKHPTPVRAYIGPFRVEGNLYLPQYSDLEVFLNRIPEPFLALTDVSIFPPAREQLGIVRIPFALARRDRLVVTGLEGEQSET